MKMVSTTIYISKEQERLLKEVKKETGIPVAKLIRDGVDMVLEKNEPQAPLKLDWKVYEKPADLDWEDHGSHWVGFLTDENGVRHAVGFINKAAAVKLKQLLKRR